VVVEIETASGQTPTVASAQLTPAKVRLIAFYLPQFYPLPENDEWWGKGFTEWTNVVKAKPLFPGHYQPHLPADLGFYDLRVPEVRAAQAQLAREYGIHGFCYYHYWFNGRPVLGRPFSEVLASGKPELPFCLCWANENWTRAWDGKERQVLLRQEYSLDDDRAHIRALIPAFRDPRYIRVDGKPLFLVYRTEHMPGPARTAEIWREESIREGIGDIYLARVESFSARSDPRRMGFDAAVEFAPDWRNLQDLKYRNVSYRFLNKLGVMSDVYFKLEIARYEGMVRRMLDKGDSDYVRFRCVAPGFDNTPRRSEGAVILGDATPEQYEVWLAECVERTLARYRGDERIVFVNAWNEWAEGNHLEPDTRHGLAYLEATRRALTGETLARQAARATQVDHDPVAPSLAKRLYWRLIKLLRDVLEIAKAVTFMRP